MEERLFAYIATSYKLSTMKAFVLLTLLFALTGCVTTQFKSNTDFQALQRFNRILVVSKLPNVSSEYLASYTQAFPEQYSVCVVDASPLVFGNPDSLIVQKARECGSEVTLMIDFKRNFTAGDGKYITSMSEVFFELASFPARQPFWKAIATCDISSYAIPARHIVRQLADDSLIEGKIPTATYQASR
jgi:hypothetical protein